MKIGIIGAIEQETQKLEKIINTYRTENVKKYTIFIGKLQKNDIFLIKSGIGKVSASMATMILINLYRPDIIINSGSAGSIDSSLKIGDIIVPNKICYYDVNLTNFGYSKGQIPGNPQKFIINTTISSILKKYNNDKDHWIFKTGLIISGDSFINDNDDIKKLKNQFSSAIAVEMESAAIAQVCYQFNIPLIVVKSISDSSNNHATLNFKKNILIASFKSSKFVKIILENILI